MPRMLPNIIRNVFSSPATRKYPFETREPFTGSRGKIVFKSENCTCCGACARRCPAEAITVDREKRQLTFKVAHCIICEACIEACPKNDIVLDFKWRAPYYSKPVEVHDCPPKEEKKAEAQG